MAIVVLILLNHPLRIAENSSLIKPNRKMYYVAGYYQRNWAQNVETRCENICAAARCSIAAQLSLLIAHIAVHFPIKFTCLLYRVWTSADKTALCYYYIWVMVKIHSR
jgi:hypothetical protein